MELWPSLVVVLGLAGSALGIQSLDRAAAVLVVLFVAFAGYDIGASALAALRARGLLQVDHAHHRRPVWHAFLPTALAVLVAFYFASGSTSCGSMSAPSCAVLGKSWRPQ